MMLKLFKCLDIYLLLPLSIFTGFELTYLWNEINKVCHYLKIVIWVFYVKFLVKFVEGLDTLDIYKLMIIIIIIL
jgi:hypothetical protein